MPSLGLWSDKANKTDRFFSRMMYNASGELIKVMPFNQRHDYKTDPFMKPFDDIISYGLCYYTLEEIPKQEPEFCD